MQMYKKIGVASLLSSLLGSCIFLSFWGVVFHALKLHVYTFSSIFEGILLILTIYLAQLYYKSQNGGYMSYREGFLIGVLTSMFLGIFLGTSVYVYTLLIQHDFLKILIEYMSNTLIQLMLVESVVNKIIAQLKIHLSPFTLLYGTFMIVTLTGTIFSFLISAISSRKLNHAVNTQD